MSNNVPAEAVSPKGVSKNINRVQALCGVLLTVRAMAREQKNLTDEVLDSWVLDACRGGSRETASTFIDHVAKLVALANVLVGEVKSLIDGSTSKYGEAMVWKHNPSSAAFDELKTEETAENQEALH